ncbi:hypothetical protein LCGC14_2486810, partial [marine sediment metagenome]
MVAFRMRKKPSAPEQKMLQCKEELYNYTSFERLLELIPDADGHLAFEESHSYGGYYDHDEATEVYLVWEEPEDIEAFDKRYK